MKLEDLRDKHAGETVWVLGSGPSLNFIDSGFFADKVVVSTNFAAQVMKIRPQFLFTHYHENAQELLDTADVVVTLEHDTMTRLTWQSEPHASLVLIPQDSPNPPGIHWNIFGAHTPRDDSLAYGTSSLHGSMHLAAWLGASHIMMVGADCGAIDGEHRVLDYPEGEQPWDMYDRHHREMKQWLEQNYGVTVYSLNPFINLNLEGHKFEGVS